MDFEEEVRKRLEECSKIEDKVKRFKCVVKVFNEVTRAQDIAQLSVIGWDWSLAMTKDITNRLNSVLLRIGHWDFNPLKFMKYDGDAIREKLLGVINGLNELERYYRKMNGERTGIFFDVKLIEKEIPDKLYPSPDDYFKFVKKLDSNPLHKKKMINK
ncbi:MAG TPA: hypothetical protein ENG16_01670 [Archaeoglobus sp.]|nr:hypothetical protein [Archaeoglobus sp.]